MPSLKVVFTNGIVWRCIPESIFNNDDKIFKDEQVVVVKSELLDADIGKSSYEISFISQNGQLIFKSIETISPLNLIIKK
ncbi:MAG: hypothetical protein N2746_01600 [Deltaproteobacteria bacterium]|nr:hypothetical protein [Deltaproteobacteria bacterium]